MGRPRQRRGAVPGKGASLGDVQVDAQAAPRPGRRPGRLGPVTWADPQVCCGHENPPCGELPPAREAAEQAPSCWWWPRCREPGRELEPPPATAPGGQWGGEPTLPGSDPWAPWWETGKWCLSFMRRVQNISSPLPPCSWTPVTPHDPLHARPRLHLETSLQPSRCVHGSPHGGRRPPRWGAHGCRGHPASPCLQPAGA